MTLKIKAPVNRLGKTVTSALSPQALDRWTPAIQASTDDERTIGIYDVIGYDWWDEGVTAKRIAAALRKMGPGEVTVNINSPGGDMFEGFTIYNMLRAHDGDVTVNILGLAASAASIIAMGANTLNIAKAGFLMIHNSWVYTAGNRHELLSIAEQLQPFDLAMAEVYADRSGQPLADIQAMLDAETWLNGSTAIDKGLADGFLAADSVKSDELSDDGYNSQLLNIRKIETALRNSGLSRSQSQKVISEFKQSCVSDSTDVNQRDAINKAGASILATANGLLDTLQRKST